jgi:hypothetical protein
MIEEDANRIVSDGTQNVWSEACEKTDHIGTAQAFDLSNQGDTHRKRH